MMKPTEQHIINQIDEIKDILDAANRPGLRCLSMVMDMLKDEDQDYAREKLERMYQDERIPDGSLILEWQF